MSLVACQVSPIELVAAQFPSLFRGVVVADSPLGVRVVSVEDSSQAHWADLRPEDIIVRVQDTDVHSIDEFASMSNALKGQAVSTTLLVFRSGQPRELTLHLYSYPILRAWGLSFVPDHDVRFAEAQTGLSYWTKLGRGFEEAGKPDQALEAYLNGLHNVPDDSATALKVNELLFQVSQRHLAAGRLAEGLARLRQSLQILERLFEYTLSAEQLASIRRQLQETLQVLRQASKAR